MRLLLVLAAAAAAALPSIAVAGRVASKATACAVLTEVVPKHVQLRNDSNDYYCELRNVSRRYYVFALRQ